jgi:hypothetical protein
MAPLRFSRQDHYRKKQLIEHPNMPQNISGVWGLDPKEQQRKKGIQKCFLNQLLTIIKTVADPGEATPSVENSRRKLQNVVENSTVEKIRNILIQSQSCPLEREIVLLGRADFRGGRCFSIAYIRY